MIGKKMKDSMKASGVSRTPVADLRLDKILSPRGHPTRVGVRSKLSSSNVEQSKKCLSWYVALKSKPSEKITHIPQIKWKCPPKFALNTSWHVAAGEGSQEAETQKRWETTVVEVVYPDLTVIPPSPFTTPHTEGQCSDNSPTPIIPIIPIEEVAGETPFDTSASDEVLSVPGNLLVSQSSDPSGPLDQTALDESLPSMLLGLERVDLEVAATAAATVAAVMEKKEQIDTQLLIKLLTDPEMVKKLLEGNGPTSKPENGTPPEPNPNMPLPLPNSTPVSEPNEPVKQLNHLPTSKPENGAPPAPNPNTPLPLPNSKPVAGYNEPVKKLNHLPTSKPENGTAPAPNPNMPLPLPNSTSIPEYNEPVKILNHLPTSKPENGTPPAPNPNMPLPLPKSTPVSEYNEPVKKLNHLPISSPYLPLHENLTSQPGIKQVRPLMPYTLRPNEEIERLVNKYLGPDITGVRPLCRPNEKIERLVSKYLAPDIAGVRPAGLLNPPTSNQNLQTIKKMIHEYGAPDAPLVEKPMNGYGVDSGCGNPFVAPSPVLLPPTPLPPVTNPAFPSNFTVPGDFRFPFFSLAPTPAPNADLSYCKSLIEQHGEGHEMGEPKLPIIGQHGNYLQGFEKGHNNPSSIVINPEFPKRCVYFNSAKGCWNGYNCQYQHDVSRQGGRGAMKAPVAKKMKFIER